MEDGTSWGTTHDLLLALAGRVDDDLLSWARELVALGEDARAVELLTASLVAARAVLPAPLRAALVAAARAARTDLGPATALPEPRAEDGTEHRFAEPAGDDPVAGAMLDIPARPLAGCRVLLSRRLTPAGTAPGPLPHPVVLVEVHSGTRPAEVLAYQLAAALGRAGAPASVEVLAAGGPVSAYHAAALERAVELRSDTADDAPWRPDRRTDDRDDRPDQDAAVATAVLPVTHSQPIPDAPVEERHSLAPPAEPSVDQPTYRLDEPLASEPPVDRAPAPLAELPTEESRPVEPRGRHAPEPPPDHPVDEAEPPARRRAPAPSPRQVADAAPRAHRLDEPGPIDPPARRRLPEPPADDRGSDDAEPATGLLPMQEREHDAADAATGRLRAEPGNAHRRDDLGDLGDLDDHGDAYDGQRDGWGADLPAEPEDADALSDEPPEPHPLAEPRPLRDGSRQAFRPTPLPTTGPTPIPAPSTRPRPTVTPISRPAVSNPIPLIRRGGPAPIPRTMPVTEPRPFVRRIGDDRDVEPRIDERTDERADRSVDQGPAELPAAERPAAPETKPERETPAFQSLSDPLNGPLHQPLLAPLLDPMIRDDPLGARRPVAGTEDAPPEDTPAADDEWSAEWLSGTWAMAPSAFNDRANTRRDREPDAVPDGDAEPHEPQERPAPRPVPRRARRHRYADEPEPESASHDENDSERDDGRDGDGDLVETSDTGSRDDPDGDPEPARRDAGLRSDPAARLSDADRQLLARLQSELLEGRKPRIGRGAGIAGGPATNGSHRTTPPDLAG